MKILRTLLFGVICLFALSPNAGALSLILQAGPEGKDALLIKSGGANNYNNYEYLSVNWGNNSADNGLIEFDLGLLAGTIVTSASLSLYHVFNDGNGATFGLWQNFAAWDEANVTWNNSPSFGNLVASLNINDNLTDVWRLWDITNIVSNWISGTAANYGLRIGRTDQLNSEIYLASSDYDKSAFRPILTVEYQMTPVPEPGTVLLFGAAIIGLIGVGKMKRKRINRI